MLLSIIIPAYNEKGTIKELIRRVKKAPLPIGVKKEIIVIDDGSTDGTREILEKTKGIIFIKHKKNSGKGAAMKTGFEASKGDVLITQDADLEYDPDFYPRLLEPFLKKKAKVVYGSRFLYLKQKQKNISFLQKAHSGSYYLAYLGGRIMTATSNLLYQANITDEATGYKLLHRDVADKIELESRRFEFCPEITAKILKLGYKIHEVPISYKPRTFEDGKKINWKDGLEGLYTLFKYRIQKMKHVPSKSALKNRHLEDVNCNICGSNNFKVLFPELPGMASMDPKEVFSSSSHEISREQIVECKKCGLVYTTPRFKASSIVSGYSSAQDSDYTSQEETRLQTFRKNLSVLNSFTKKKGRLLDIGAAAGYFVKVADEDGWQAEGIEPSAWMSKYAQKKLGIKVRPGTVHDYRFKSGTFDAVTYWDVLEHVPDPMKDLEKTAKLLKRGGILIVNYPDWASFPAKIFKRKWWFVLSIHLYYFTPKTITKILNKAGFRVLNIRPHFQTLELGYLVYRLKPYSKALYNLMNPVIEALGLTKLGIPYYAGQTMVIAKKK